MSLDIFYLKKRFQTKEITFDEMVSAVLSEQEHIASNFVDILSYFKNEIVGDDREYLFNIIKTNVVACRDFVLRCEPSYKEKIAALDILINKSRYDSIIKVIREKNDYLYVTKNLGERVGNTRDYSKLMYKIFDFYLELNDEDPYKEKMFEGILGNYHLIVGIIGNMYLMYSHNPESKVFSEEELGRIYKRHGENLLSENLSFVEYYSMCIVMFKWLTYENKQELVFRVLDNRLVVEASILLKPSYRLLFNLGEDLIDMLESFLIMERLAI